MNLYVTLLRGINVGGNNLIKMTALKQCFERAGFQNVITYIQSGNVIFDSAENNHEKLTLKIEKLLSQAFLYESRVVIRSFEEMRQIVSRAPREFGKDPAKFRYDVLFLKEPLSPKEALKEVGTKDGVDQVYSGKNVLYFSRLIIKASQSHLARIVTRPVYRNMTIRNWNTTTKLLEIMQARRQVLPQR